jgi:hypothetical protein
MILASLAALSLMVNVSVDPGVHTPAATIGHELSAQKKDTVMQPLVKSATDCVVRNVTADPRLPQSLKAGDIRELIVSSMTPCANAMRAMIEEHDRLFGSGSGEEFFMGSYLKFLPTSVNAAVKAGNVAVPGQAGASVAPRR